MPLGLTPFLTVVGGIAPILRWSDEPLPRSLGADIHGNDDSTPPTRFSGLDLSGSKPIDWALAYAAVGMKVVPVKRIKDRLMPCTEHAIHDATTDPSKLRTWWKREPYADALWAIETDTVVIDLDTKKGKNGPKEFERLTGLRIDDIATPIATSPSGGKHLYFLANGVPYGPNTDVGAPGIDLCATGPAGPRGVVLPGPGNGRLWLKPLTGPWSEAPQFFADWMRQKAARRAAAPEPGEARPFTGQESRRARKALDAACNALAEAGPGERDVAVGKHVLRVGSLAGAGELDPQAALAALIGAARACRGAASDYPSKVERAFRSGLATPAAPSKKAKPPRTGWLADAMVDERDRVIANLANVMLALRSDPHVVKAFAFDEMMQTPLIVEPVPIAPGGKAAESTDDVLPRPVRDADASQLQEWLQHQGLPRVGVVTVHQAIHQRARERGFHPVRRWLEGLKWDGKERLSGWLATYLGATGDVDYLMSIGRMFLISMVARIMKAGCKADYMLVLEGDQGVEKSQACAILAGDYFSDSLPDIHHKDSSQHLRGKWLIEVSELAAFTRAESEALKAFISRSVEKYRPPYGREDVVEPRQCLFIGTTNKEMYLKDETGGRRYWPIKTGRFDLAALRRDREQLFAEAADRYLHAEQWWPDPAFERQYIKPQQDLRYEDDAWRGDIAAYIALHSRVTITAVARGALGFDVVAKVGTADQRRIAGVLTSLGWGPGERDMGHRYYVPRK
jgi:predicted P-loop ATPase